MHLDLFIKLNLHFTFPISHFTIWPKSIIIQFPLIVSKSLILLYMHSLPYSSIQFI